MNRTLKLSLLVVLGLTLAACGSTKKNEEPTTRGVTVDQSEPLVDRNYMNTGMTQSELEGLGIMGNPLDYKTLYFEYNSTAIDRRSEVIARAHARALGESGGAKVVLEGHADERGTRDYNLALGELRSQAVGRLMADSGAGNSELQTISYGEERPADASHSEAAWQANRRVEISY
ncbi:MAG: peptidoglycan-associated lipoprotein [Arenicella sp.]|jgi:peptidoglycan-associated lipoprotein